MQASCIIYLHEIYFVLNKNQMATPTLFGIISELTLYYGIL